MSSNRNTEQWQWDIDRYVLRDESLDREAFESRMFENEQLALAVADAVGELEKISGVCRSLAWLEPVAELSGSAISARDPALGNRAVGNWVVVLATLATVILLAVLSQFAWRQSNSRVALGQSETVQLTQLAENWIAMKDIEVAIEDKVLITTVTDSDGADAADAEDSADWILEAAQQFFEEWES